MRKLAEFVMRGRRQAILTALLFSVLPFLGWVADIIMLLVTLRRGSKEGALVLIWIILPSVIVALNGYSEIWVYGIVGGSLLSYGLAVILRYTASWAIVLELATLLGILAVVIIHIYLPNITAFWQAHLTDFIITTQKTLDLPKIDAAVLQNWTLGLAKIATGSQIAILLVTDWINLGIARWLQAWLYNPHGLRAELYHIRLSKIAVGLLVIIGVATLFGSKTALDCVILGLTPFILAGLSLVHCVMATTRSPWLWLIGFYLLLILFFIYFAVLVIALALMDCWWDFRKRLVGKNL